MFVNVEASGMIRKDGGSWMDTPINVHLGAGEVGWQALGPAIACTALATIVVASRWYTRCKLARCLGVDDWVISFSMVLAWCMCTIIGAELNEGLGVYEGGRAIDASHLAKLIVINNNLWALAVSVTKASILAQYLRIFSGRTTRWLCYTLLVALIPAVCWTIFGGTFLCRPVAKLWKPDLPGHCMNAQRYWISAAAVNIGLDFLVLLLPMPAIAGLRLPTRQRICLLLVFLLGFFVCIVSIVRLVMVYVTAERGDLVASGIQAVTWSAVEVNVGIICASLLALKPLLVRFWPFLLEDTGIPQHCLRLPMVQTSSLSHGRGTEVATLVHAESPPSPTSPITAKTKDGSSTWKRRSTTTTLPGVPQAEGLSFLDMLALGPEVEAQDRSIRR